ncbi:ABC transporter ATP-binding protein [Phaeovulum sp. W22_SRMD_FR3]|uniref:ABC transporter ATP-binding protein n=1 Tax=Phaeovulum sp. W22_SRMD_FR3 TaxID=3240274 RepID=UPI003F9AC69A
MTQMLEITNLAIALPDGHRLLDQVSLNVAPGEVRALVGESGAGKSMIGKAVLGILPPGLKMPEGEIMLGGAPLGGLTPRQRRQRVAEVAALIPQDPLTALNPVRKIGVQITDPLVRIHGWSRARAEAKALDLLDRVQIRNPGRVMRSYPHELSGGMRQRVLIAAAFAPAPRLIVADEPTTALDVTVQREILRIIRGLQEETGTAVLFVTHDMGVVAKISQSVTVLYNGRIVESGPTAKLMTAPDHAYTAALIRATPNYAHPTAAFAPVPEAVIAALRAEQAAAARFTA